MYFHHELIGFSYLICVLNFNEISFLVKVCCGVQCSRKLDKSNSFPVFSKIVKQ